MLVNLDNYDALDMLVERVREWTDDEEVVRLYEEYYRNLIEEGAFDGGDFNVDEIVDNDWINWTEVGTREEIEEQYEDLDEITVLAELGDLILYYAG